LEGPRAHPDLLRDALLAGIPATQLLGDEALHLLDEPCRDREAGKEHLRVPQEVGAEARIRREVAALQDRAVADHTGLGRAEGDAERILRVTERFREDTDRFREDTDRFREDTDRFLEDAERVSPISRGRRRMTNCRDHVPTRTPATRTSAIVWSAGPADALQR